MMSNQEDLPDHNDPSDSQVTDDDNLNIDSPSNDDDDHESSRSGDEEEFESFEFW